MSPLRKIRVLVVDDSAFLRRNLPRMLESDLEIEVIGTAANGQEAVQAVKDLRPDVVTLDVMMPVMDGLAALRQIMRECPTPVIMVSSATHERAQETLQALALGAIDIVEKPSGPISLDIDTRRQELVDKIKHAYAAKIKAAASVDVTREKFRALIEQLSQGRTSTVAPPRVNSDEPALPTDKRLIAIAASTGGPAALQVVIPALPADLPAGVLVIQHIAAGFTRPLAERLNHASKLTVREACDGDLITPGLVLICPGDMHMTVAREGRGLCVHIAPEPTNILYRPSADVLFNSLARVVGEETCAAVLTGMGDDGALGLREIRERGGYTIAQDQATSLIYGMPRRALELGGALISLPLERIAAHIARTTGL